MLDHIRKEDEEDFPKLIQYSQGQDVQNIKIILEDLINDHEDTGQLLKVMNQLTSDYQAEEVWNMEACLPKITKYRTSNTPTCTS